MKLHNSTGLEFRECIKHMAEKEVDKATEITLDTFYSELEDIISKTNRKLNLTQGGIL